MVVEHCYVLSLDEIKALRFRCCNCGASTSFQMSQTVNFPVQCPGCREILYDSTLDRGDSGELHALPRILKQLIARRNQPSEILLEVHIPK